MSRVGTLLAVAYPFLVLGGLQVLEPRQLVLATGAVLAVRAVLHRRAPTREQLRSLVVPAASVGALLVAGWIWNDPRFLMFLPALVSLALLAAFARTLRRGPTMVETFARMQRGDLSPARVRHCREATVAWCAFFALNAALCAALGAYAAPETWALYTGFVAYLVMGLLFAGEFIVRAARFEDEPVPPLLRRLLPRGRAS